MTTNEILETAKPHPEFQQIQEQYGPMPALQGDIHQVRKVLEDSKAAFTASQGGQFDDIVEKDATLQTRDGYALPYRLYKPASPPSTGSPLVILLHGGGFCLGGLTNEELNCRLFAQKFGCVCLNIDYRLAPEHPYPAAINDAWDATKWAAENAASLGADPSQGFIVGGTSAGANLTDSVAHIARDEKLAPPITGLLEMIPPLIPNGRCPDKYKEQYLAWEQNKDAPILPHITIDWFTDMYKPDFSSGKAYPMIHPAGHAGIPPVFFQVCGMDPLRDDAIIYERVLREELGTPTQLKMYPGVPHGFWSLFPHMKLSKQFVEDTMQGMSWLLSRPAGS